ncbi:MAG: hypothetical protein RI900_2672 [Actinomycetota bacterium]
MTKDVDDQGERRSRCKWCRRVLPGQRTGRPRQFCSQACRQWHWVGQQRARELQLREGELVVATAELDALHDDLFVLACAVDDAERDLKASGSQATAAELREMLDWLLEAARPLRDRETGNRVQRP